MNLISFGIGNGIDPLQIKALIMRYPLDQNAHKQVSHIFANLWKPTGPMRKAKYYDQVMRKYTHFL